MFDNSVGPRRAFLLHHRLAAGLLMAAALGSAAAGAAPPSLPGQADPFYHRTFLQGEKALLEGDYAAAAQALEIARFGLRSGDPAALKALLYLGICHFQLNDRGRSREDLTSALASLSGRRLDELDLHPWVRSSLGRILKALGMSPEDAGLGAADRPATGESKARPAQPGPSASGSSTLSDLERERRLRPDDRTLAFSLVRAYVDAGKHGSARQLARSLAAADPADPEAAFWSAKADYLRRDFRAALTDFNALLGPAFAARRSPDIDRRSRIYAILCLQNLNQAASVKTYLSGLSEFVPAPELDRILEEEGLTTAWRTMKARMELKTR